MSKMIKCDGCGKAIDFSKRQTLERIELNGTGFTVNIEVLNKYSIPKSLGSRYPVAMAMPVSKDEDLDLCPECFAKAITALKAQLNR